MIDPGRVRLFIPPGLKGFKQDLFDRIGRKVGGSVRDYDKLAQLPDDVIPIVGCTAELRPLIDRWQARGRTWIYWDRGYCRRVFATDLPRGADGGMYRWHINAFQMAKIRQVPSDRWIHTKTEVIPWSRNGRHIVIAEPSPYYAKFHRIEDWTERTVRRLREITDRPLVSRTKEMQRRASDHMAGGRRLWDDLQGAHALVTHGSNAAVEAVIMGCPVFVDASSAAALVGKTDLGEIEDPIYPEREPWLWSLAYCQFNESELVDGTLWALME
jgi:hypothetical protein